MAATPMWVYRIGLDSLTQTGPFDNRDIGFSIEARLINAESVPVDWYASPGTCE